VNVATINHETHQARDEGRYESSLRPLQLLRSRDSSRPSQEANKCENPAYQYSDYKVAKLLIKEFQCKMNAQADIAGAERKYE
jgi:hypothetical protein